MKVPAHNPSECEPGARSIDWTPSGYGTSGRSHELRRSEEGWQLRPTVGARLGFGLFLLVGPLTSAVLVVDGLPWVMLLIPAIGWLVTVASVKARREVLASVTFDGASRRVRRSRSALPHQSTWVPSATFDQARALQLLPVRGTEAPMYELNLALHDGKRLHLMTHGDLRSLEADATHLGQFLGVPTWRHDSLC